MKASKLKSFLRQIDVTTDKELDCNGCFAWVSEYVDREIAGEEVAREMPAVKHHLDLCQVCREEYETLRDLARLEQEGRAPSADELRQSF